MLAAGVEIVSLPWGDPSPYVERVHAAGALLIGVAGTAVEAGRLANAGVDVVCAQGWEAGGHVWSEVSTLALVPAVVDAVAPVPVLAAGGIVDGRGIAAALALGAQGVWLGTRFLLAEEAAVHPDYREHLLRARAEDAVYARDLFDVGWEDAPHRALRNSTRERWEAAGSPAPGERPGEGETVATRADGAPIVPLLVRDAGRGPLRRDRSPVHVVGSGHRPRRPRPAGRRDRPRAGGRGRAVIQV